MRNYNCSDDADFSLPCFFPQWRSWTCGGLPLLLQRGIQEWNGRARRIAPLSFSGACRLTLSIATRSTPVDALRSPSPSPSARIPTSGRSFQVGSPTRAPVGSSTGVPASPAPAAPSSESAHQRAGLGGLHSQLAPAFNLGSFSAGELPTGLQVRGLVPSSPP